MGIAGVSLLFLGLQVSVTCVAPRVALTDSCSFFFPSGTSEPPVKFVYAHYFKAMTIAVACLWGRRSLGGEAQWTLGWQLCSFLGKDNEGMNVDPAVNIAHGFLVLSVKSWWGKKSASNLDRAFSRLLQEAHQSLSLPWHPHTLLGVLFPS